MTTPQRAALLVVAPLVAGLLLAAQGFGVPAQARTRPTWPPAPCASMEPRRTHTPWPEWTRLPAVRVVVTATPRPTPEAL
jgi:hypothetical protein